MVLEFPRQEPASRQPPGRWGRRMLNRIDSWRERAGEQASMLGAEACDFELLDEVARRLRERVLREL